MTTTDRANAIAQASSLPAQALIDLVAAELGHAEALDRFVPYGDLHTRARPLSPILHILAGNTPEAAIQSISRGLLLGAQHLAKLPAGGIPEVDAFLAALPNPLSSLVQTTTERELAATWIEDAAAVIAFGTDETIWEIRSMLSANQVFIPPGHKVSIAIVDADPDGGAATLAATDIAAHDQRGCLSPHDIYVAPELQPRSFAANLARELAKCGRPGERSFEENACIDHLRRSYSFRAASDTSVQIWQSEGNTDWTVVFEEESQFAASPLGRFAFVKPLPESLAAPLSFVSEHLSTIALHPFSIERSDALSDLGAHRICPLGKAQTPSPFWHHDGGQVLAPLVRWIDVG
jgi:hypothetical protein